MEIYKTNGEWYATASGGYRNRDYVPETTVGPFSSRPEPVYRWKTTEKTQAGYGKCVYTQFVIDNVPAFVLRDYHWSPTIGYSWDESWEDIVPVVEALPPELGECYRWTGEGWEASPHPMSVE